jgi:hypothetical protein
MRIAVVVVFLFLSRLVLGDQPAPIRPDPKLTPGATFDVTVKDISTPGYSKKVRHVTAEMRREVFKQYGISHYNPGDYEVDHLIPLSLGGSNSIQNLWPESYRTTLNAHVKDRLEDRLHALVVHGSVDLKAAQKEISEDWIAAYQKHVGPLPTAIPQSRSAAQSEGRNQVWVNTRSGKYFHPNSQWYGKTKSGEYMSESEAIQKGYRAAKGG